MAEELGLPKELVEKTYKHYWKWIKDTIADLPLKEDLSKEEFDQLRTNFNLPSLGKLTCTHPEYVKAKKRFKYIGHVIRYKHAKNKED